MPTPHPRWWGGPFDTEQLARTAVHRVRDAAARVVASRGLTVDVGTTDPLIAASFAAIEHLRIDGRTPSAWAELSGFSRARDGWVRLHGNYPHHAAALQELYGIRDRDGLDRALAVRPAAQIEQEVAAAGSQSPCALRRNGWRIRSTWSLPGIPGPRSSTAGRARHCPHRAGRTRQRRRRRDRRPGGPVTLCSRSTGCRCWT